MQTYPRMLGSVRRLTSSVVVKTACTEYLQREAEALQFILRNTTIPVPIVYDLRPASVAGRSHLFLQFMEGEMLARKWRVLTPAQRRAVMGKLGEFVGQLRNSNNRYPVVG
jgi:tRNA A-37 threonylcarbamoyl transferase component Bud32